MRVLILCSVALALASCQSMPQNEDDPATVTSVVSAIKEDIGVYQNYDAIAAEAKPLNNTCHGKVDFYIVSVRVSLTTQTDNTKTGNGSATLPVGSATFGPSLYVSKETIGTQTLTFTLYPIEQPTPREHHEVPDPNPIDANQYPIAASLQRLRNDLLAASQIPPCMTLAPPVGSDGKIKDDGITYAIGFTVIKQTSAKARLKFLVFSLGATNMAQRQAGNTITVTFKARPGSDALMFMNK